MSTTATFWTQRVTADELRVGDRIVYAEELFTIKELVWVSRFSPPMPFLDVMLTDPSNKERPRLMSITLVDDYVVDRLVPPVFATSERTIRL